MANDLEVVFLHGQPGKKEDFALVHRWMDPRLRVVCMDRPGWGSNPLGVVGIEANAKWVLEQFGSRRVLLIGHSLGATIAVRAAQLDPERVAGLVLAAPPITQSSLVAIDRLLAARFFGDMTSALIAGVTLGIRRHSQFGRTRRSFLAEQRHLLAELRLVENQLPFVRCPSVIVAGLRDRVVPLAAMVHAADRLPSATLELLPASGHDILHSSPVALAAMIRGLLGQLRGDRRLESCS
ncbi:alpha/beta fold hydrolase [Ferrimicrobium acidiphilum]|uniref:alpha/beta fold hydrolase n=1 Tax=Ferrimicrobium acidiphilum TaxID=121039 RepID=UPI0023F50588|nr:alpha/beta fold hydrolase [Ferrimicrobium acidiphilum]